jgi:hypothetical protein
VNQTWPPASDAAPVSVETPDGIGAVLQVDPL